jgi:ribosomal-protein-alanine N-acetyltransferase
MKTKTIEGIQNYQSPVEDYRIQDMEVIHLLAVLEIEQESFQTPWPYKAFLEDISNQNAITLTVLGEESGSSDPHVLGYGIAWVIFDELHIGNIAIRKRFRRKGIGERLVGELLSRGEERGIRLATLEVRISNESAVQLYKKFGFHEVAIRKSYYQPDGEDALVMLLQIG